MDWLWKITSVALAAYIGFCVLLYVMQPGMIFYPNMPGRELVSTPAVMGLDYEDVRFEAGDQTQLHGWYIPSPASNQNPKPLTLLFLHGNAGNISHRMDSIRLFHDMGLNVFIFDYRGYGQSSGNISELGMYQDAEAAWRYLQQTRGVDEYGIIVFGRSLGGSVAAWLASRYQPAALIVESSFSSVDSMAQRLYPFLPVRWLSRFRFDTKSYIQEVRSPVLVVHSREDEIIPFAEGLEIFETASEPRQFLEIHGGHNDGHIISGERYRDSLLLFIRKYSE